jgi:hypothetical protein
MLNQPLSSNYLLISVVSTLSENSKLILQNAHSYSWNIWATYQQKEPIIIERSKININEPGMIVDILFFVPDAQLLAISFKAFITKNA